MPEFILKSGAKLVVTMSPFSVGNSLRKAVARALSGQTDALSEGALNSLVANDEVEQIFFLCAQSAIYVGAKVNPALFDLPDLATQARGDYFEIFAKILEVNLNPFFPQASSGSSTQAPAKA